jgi:hypothetical protein
MKPHDWRVQGRLLSVPRLGAHSLGGSVLSREYEYFLLGASRTRRLDTR